MLRVSQCGLWALAAVAVLSSSVLAPASEQHAAARFMGSSSTSHTAVGYLGVDVRGIGDEQISTLKLKDTHGAEIVRVDHDGPAGKCGLREHDVVLTLNGQMIESEEQIRRMLHELAPGRTVTLVISRDGQTMNMNTQMADRGSVERDAWENHIPVDDPYTPPAAAPEANEGFSGSSGTRLHGGMSFLGPMKFLSSSYTGAMLETLGPQLAGFFGAPTGVGLLVRSVESNSPAAMAGLKAGDVAIRANTQKLHSPGDWSKAIKESKGHPVAVLVLRDRKEVTLTLVPDGKKHSEVEQQRVLAEWALLTEF